MEDLDHHIKAVNSVPSIENMVPNQLYAITLSPNDSVQFWDENSIRRHHSFKEWIEHHLEKYLAPYADYTFVIELSSLGRLHVHGTMQFVDISHIARFYIASIRNLQSSSTVYIKYIDDIEIWNNYMDKQFSYWNSLNFDRHIDKKITTQIKEHISDKQILKDQMKAIKPIKLKRSSSPHWDLDV